MHGCANLWNSWPGPPEKFKCTLKKFRNFGTLNFILFEFFSLDFESTPDDVQGFALFQRSQNHRPQRTEHLSRDLVLIIFCSYFIHSV